MGGGKNIGSKGKEEKKEKSRRFGSSRLNGTDKLLARPAIRSPQRIGGAAAAEREK
jgi:hypothetical protein